LAFRKEQDHRIAEIDIKVSDAEVDLEMAKGKLRRVLLQKGTMEQDWEVDTNDGKIDMIAQANHGFGKGTVLLDMQITLLIDPQKFLQQKRLSEKRKGSTTRFTKLSAS